MEQQMTIEEIEARYDGEWVLLEDPQTNENLEVLGGKVLWHSLDRDEVYQKAIDLRPKRSAFLFNGETPEDLVLIL